MLCSFDTFPDPAAFPELGPTAPPNLSGSVPSMSGMARLAEGSASGMEASCGCCGAAAQGGAAYMGLGWRCEEQMGSVLPALPGSFRWVARVGPLPLTRLLVRCPPPPPSSPGSCCATTATPR